MGFFVLHERKTYSQKRTNRIHIPAIFPACRGYMSIVTNGDDDRKFKLR